jgi:hypothetical protein
MVKGIARVLVKSDDLVHPPLAQGLLGLEQERLPGGPLPG